MKILRKNAISQEKNRQKITKLSNMSHNAYKKSNYLICIKLIVEELIRI